jgi:hypothetical protein
MLQEHEIKKHPKIEPFQKIDFEKFPKGKGQKEELIIYPPDPRLIPS